LKLQKASFLLHSQTVMAMKKNTTKKVTMKTEEAAFPEALPTPARSAQPTPAVKGKGFATCMLLDYLPDDDNDSCSDNDSLDLEQLGLEKVDEALTVGSQIGQGRFKNVYAGHHRQHGSVAVLRIPSDKKRNEVRMLALLAKMENSCLYIPEVFGALQDPSGDLLVAQELSMLGSVRSALQDANLASILTPQHRLHVAAQLAGAIGFLEAARIIHTDVACRNVLLFQLEKDAPELTSAKLTDFGFGTCLPTDADHVILKQPQATRWCAPETVMSNKWSDKTDIWSLGVALWELFSGEATPWTRLSKRSEVAKRLRELAPNESDGKPTMTRRAPAPENCPQRELTKRLRELAHRDMISEEFPAPEDGVYSLVAHTTVLSCLRVDADMRPLASSIALVFEDLARPPAKCAAEECTSSAEVSTCASDTSTLSEVDVPVVKKLSRCTNTLIPLAPRGGASWAACNAPVQTGKWTMWTYVSPALLRQDFVSEADARDAYSCGNKNLSADLCVRLHQGSPRILRDPAGYPIAGTSWNGTSA